MTTTAESIANHGARLDSVENQVTTISAKLDHLLFLMIATLMAAVGALAAIAFKH